MKAGPPEPSLNSCTCFRIHYWNMKPACDLPLYVFCFEETERTSPRSFSSGSDPYLLLVTLESGALRYTASGREHILIPGEILIVPRNTGYAFESYSTGGFYRKLVLEIRGRDLDILTESLNLNHFSFYSLPDPARTIRTFREIGGLLETGRTDDIPLIMGKANELLYAFSLLACPAPVRPVLLQKAQSLIETKLDSPLLLKMLTEKLHTSRSTLGRLFREHLHLSPQEYIIRRKMESAEYLLKNTELSVKEIAYRLGYCNQFHFSCEFKRRTGISPAGYRKCLPFSGRDLIGPFPEKKNKRQKHFLCD